jgi:hypothetical protein
MLFTRVDLPTFGLPTTATNPERKPGDASDTSQAGSCPDTDSL